MSPPRTRLHARHVCLAAAKGKHVLVEKPMAITLSECRTMVEAARTAGVHLVVGHSHSFDAPVRRGARIVASGAVGKVGMITSLNYTDFLYRPRRPEELVTEKGGGVIFSQARTKSISSGCSAVALCVAFARQPAHGIRRARPKAPIPDY